MNIVKLLELGRLERLSTVPCKLLGVNGIVHGVETISFHSKFA